MDNNKAKTTNNNNVERDQEEEENPNSNNNELSPQSEQVDEETRSNPSRARTPFTNLSQVDADLALARTLQEQERAYMMLRMNNEGSDYGSWEGGNAFSSDEAYARALQDAEEREMAARLLALAGINDGEVEDPEDHGGNSQDTWEEIDPDELSYEELLALGEVIGTESRGLSTDTIASLPTVSYKSGSSHSGSNDSCVICRLDYEDDETVTVLSCKHSYHSDCINNWLKINKVCPVCSAEVSTSGNS
ncbi:hypothetical protein JRO89_XS05G0172500 [Xanthoceras sorbifolium]|uniref:RING-type domain-containing protein n=1 Tax=Xanthoceras sorbifolium TaxID=99658 RepID=A0ABQ8I2Q3_9ROSI|nr:hypothetical protein JRO89_XS05G0172500 [Xanthoceras sorbifolium]